LEPFRHFDLIHFVDRVGLSPIERLVLGSAMLIATNRRDLVQQANSLIRVNFDQARLAIMAHSTFENGNLSQSQVTKLLSNLLCESSLESPVLDPTYRQSLLTAIAAKYGSDCVVAILQQLLPHISLAHGTSFAQALIQFGPEWTGDLEVVRALMARFGITENAPPTDMQVLEAVSRLARYAIEGSAMPDVRVLVKAFNSFNVTLQWDKAIRVLDRPERTGIDTATLKLIVAILSEAHHAVSGFWSTWSNALYQLRLIDALLSLPSDTFSFYGLPGRTVVTVDDVANASPTIKTLAQNVQSSTWNSLDLFELLVRLDESEEPGVKTQVREMLDRAVRVSAELVHMGLLQVPVSSNHSKCGYLLNLMSETVEFRTTRVLEPPPIHVSRWSSQPSTRIHAYLAN
jgi:CCR4-NOT transcription complex subunit 1